MPTFRIYCTRYCLLLLLSMISFQGTTGQDTSFVRKIICTLSSRKYKGRGYVDGADKKAASLIEREFRLDGLESFNGSYLQPFFIKVNTFPGRMSVKVNGKRLKPGADFLVDPSCPSAKGKYQVLSIGSNELADRQSIEKKLLLKRGQVLWVDDRQDSLFLKEERQSIKLLAELLHELPEVACAGVVIYRPGKLTWSVSGDVMSIPVCYVSSRFQAGPVKTVQLAIQNELLPNDETQNMAGFIKGNQTPDSVIMIVAHYDHLGMMGRRTFFPGANDNASGTAMLLDLARHYTKDENRLPCTLVFLSVAGEEAGLLGSQYFVAHPLFDLGRIKFLLNIDLAGNGSEGITVVNGSVFRDKFNLLAKINSAHAYLSQVKSRGEACNSDHCPFYRAGVPCFFLYTMGGAPYYHDIYDRCGVLTLKSYPAYFRLVSGFIDAL